MRGTLRCWGLVLPLACASAPASSAGSASASQHPGAVPQTRPGRAADAQRGAELGPEAAEAGTSAPETTPAQDREARQQAELRARLEKRRAARVAQLKAEEERKRKVQAITVIPKGAKLPKTTAKACAQTIDAHRNFMKRFHPKIPDDVLSTQHALLRKQCEQNSRIAVAMCQKFALDATTEELTGSVNDYLPVCQEKYGRDP